MNNLISATFVAILDNALATAQAKAQELKTSIVDQLGNCRDRNGNFFPTVYTTMTDIALYAGLKPEDARPGGKVSELLEEAMPGFQAAINASDQFAYARTEPFEYGGNKYVVRAYARTREDFKPSDARKAAMGLPVQATVRNQVVIHIVRAEYAEERHVVAVELTEQKRASLAAAL